MSVGEFGPAARSSERDVAVTLSLRCSVPSSRSPRQLDVILRRSRNEDSPDPVLTNLSTQGAGGWVRASRPRALPVTVRGHVP